MCQGSKSQVLIFAFPKQVADSSVASQTDGVAKLKRQLNVADVDIALVNKPLDESQGKVVLCGRLVREPKLISYNICAQCRWCRCCGEAAGRTRPS